MLKYCQLFPNCGITCQIIHNQSKQAQMLDVIPEESDLEDTPEFSSSTPELQEREEHDAFTSDEDDDVRLKVLRPKRMSRSFSEEPSLHQISNQDPESSKLDLPLGEGSPTALNASLLSWERFPRPVKKKQRKTSLMKKRRRSRNGSLSSMQYTVKTKHVTSFFPTPELM